MAIPNDCALRQKTCPSRSRSSSLRFPAFGGLPEPKFPCTNELVYQEGKKIFDQQIASLVVVRVELLKPEAGSAFRGA